MRAEKVEDGVYRLVQPPRYVGKYCLGGEMGYCILFIEKPSLIHRTFMKLLLGWEWFDIKY